MILTDAQTEHMIKLALDLSDAASTFGSVCEEERNGGCLWTNSTIEYRNVTNARAAIYGFIRNL